MLRRTGPCAPLDGVHHQVLTSFLQGCPFYSSVSPARLRLGRVNLSLPLKSFFHCDLYALMSIGDTYVSPRSKRVKKMTPRGP